MDTNFPLNWTVEPTTQPFLHTSCRWTESEKKEIKVLSGVKHSGYQGDISCYHSIGLVRLSDRLNSIPKDPVPTTNPVIKVTAKLLQFYMREPPRARMSQGWRVGSLPWAKNWTICPDWRQKKPGKRQWKRKVINTRSALEWVMEGRMRVSIWTSFLKIYIYIF